MRRGRGEVGAALDGEATLHFRRAAAGKNAAEDHVAVSVVDQLQPADDVDAPAATPRRVRLTRASDIKIRPVV